MVDTLSDLIPSFPGTPSHTRCFDHILHLAAKSLLRPFDVAHGKDAENARDATEASLRELADGLDLEELEMASMALEGSEDGDSENETGEREDVEGWVDDVVNMSETERDALDTTVQPVKLVLIKVRVLTLSGNKVACLPIVLH